MRNLTEQQVLKALPHSNWDWSNPHGESSNQIYRTIKGLWAEEALYQKLSKSGLNPRRIDYNVQVEGMNRDIDAIIFDRERIDAKSVNPHHPSNYLKPNNRKYFDWYYFYDVKFTCDFNKENLTIDNCHDLLQVVNIKPVNWGYNDKFLHFNHVKPNITNPVHGNVIGLDEFLDIKEFVEVVCSLK